MAQPGDTVYLRNNLGDRNVETQTSVVVPAGTLGVIRGEEYNHGRVLVRVDLPDSPGQKSLVTDSVSFWDIWTDKPLPHPETRYDRILAA